jgi:hypothetical protein
MAYCYLLGLFINEHAGFNNKPQSERNFQMKTTTAPWHIILFQLHLLPVFKLKYRHIKIATVDLAQLNFLLPRQNTARDSRSGLPFS